MVVGVRVGFRSNRACAVASLHSSTRASIRARKSAVEVVPREGLPRAHPRLDLADEDQVDVRPPEARRGLRPGAARRRRWARPGCAANHAASLSFQAEEARTGSRVRAGSSPPLRARLSLNGPRTSRSSTRRCRRARLMAPSRRCAVGLGSGSGPSRPGGRARARDRRLRARGRFREQLPEANPHEHGQTERIDASSMGRLLGGLIWAADSPPRLVRGSNGTGDVAVAVLARVSGGRWKSIRRSAGFDEPVPAFCGLGPGSRSPRRELLWASAPSSDAGTAGSIPRDRGLLRTRGAEGRLSAASAASRQVSTLATSAADNLTVSAAPRPNSRGRPRPRLGLSVILS